MSDLEGMINGILSNPEEMKKIMDMAGKIMGSDGGGQGAVPAAALNTHTPSLDSILSGLNREGAASTEGNLLGGGGLKSLLSGGGLQKLLGNSTVQKLISSPVVQNLVSDAVNPKNDKKELFDAMKPYLSEKRRAKMDKAMKIARLARIAKLAMGELGEDKDV